MTVVILTTETPHHAYFVREIARAYPGARVLSERRRATFPFPTHHPYEGARDAHECARWFGGAEPSVAEFAPTTSVESVNDAEALAVLDAVRPDVVVSFGTGKIAAPTIARCPTGFVNLHGGDPEQYRGLDTHLWAIYHRDFIALIATLHRVNERFDDGTIIVQAAVPLRRGMPLHELRAANAETCAALTLAALDRRARDGRFLDRPQRTRGRYYSAMPVVLKAVCIERFAQHTETLAEQEHRAPHVAVL